MLGRSPQLEGQSDSSATYVKVMLASKLEVAKDRARPCTTRAGRCATSTARTSRS